MRIRLGLGVMVAALALSAVNASACQQADLNVWPLRAAPGDPVSFSISGIQPGAEYTLSVGGRQVASGVNGTSANGVSDSFTMPDFGASPQPVEARSEAVHTEDGFGLPDTVTMQYVPPASPSSPAPAATPSEPKPSARPQPVERPNAVPTHSHGNERRSSPAPAAKPVVGAAVAEPAGDQPRSEASTAASTTREQPKSESTSAPERLADALASDTKVGPAEVPTAGLLLMALIFLGGTALAAFAIYLMQNGPDPKAAIRAPSPPGHDPVEAELQEIVAEEMARKLLSDLELGEPRVSSG